MSARTAFIGRSGGWSNNGQMVALRPFLLIILFLLVGFAPGQGMSDDQDRARAAVAAGKILPLAAIVDRAQTRFGGEVLDVEFEDDEDDEDRNGGPPRSPAIYEVKLLASGGRVLKLEYDATTGELLRVRGRAEPHGRERER